MSTREPYLFAASVAAASAVTLERVITKPGTVVKLDQRIYDGPELDIRIESFIQSPSGDRQSIIGYATGTGAKTYTDGNNDVIGDELRLPVKKGDTLVVVFTNLNATEAYNPWVKIAVDYATWAQRFS